MKKLLQKISRYEWKHLWAITLIIITLSAVPFIYAHLSAPEGYEYNGLHSLTRGDFPVYYSYINQIKNGQELLFNNFALEEQTTPILNIFWLLLGKFALLFKLEPATVIQLFKIVLTPVAIISLYIFTSYFFSDIKKRLMAIWTLCFSSGFGGYAIYIFLSHRTTRSENWPIDFWVPESNTFLTLYHLPHFILSLTLIVSIYYLFLRALETKKSLYALYAGLLGLILFNFHPYHTLTVNSVISIYLAYKLFTQPKDWFLYIRIFLLWFIPSTVSVIYHYLLILTDFAIGSRALQNVSLTPPPIYIFLGYGFVLIFAICGLYFYFKNRKTNFTDINHFDFIVIWFIVNSLLLYFPIAFQRRFLAGYHIPMVLLAIFSLQFFNNKLSNYLRTNKYLLANLLIFFVLFSNFANVVRDFVLIHQNEANFYNSYEMKETIEWLEKNNNGYVSLSPNYFVHSAPLSISFWIPATINQKTYLSHGHETLFAEEKYTLFKDLTNKNDPNAWTNFYEEFNIGYVILEPSPQNVYYNSRNLTEVFSNEKYTIYQTHVIENQE